MLVPKKLPGLRVATILLTIYGLIWIGLEGSLGRVVFLALFVTLLAAGYIVQRFLGGRELTSFQWLLVTMVSGLSIGISSALLSIFFMAIKTGLHGHGPEFTNQEINWIIQQIPLWGVVGLLAGLGIGILLLGLSRRSR